MHEVTKMFWRGIGKLGLTIIIGLVVLYSTFLFVRITIVKPCLVHDNGIYFTTEIRAYCPCEICCEGVADGITASGAKAEGLIVASSLFEFGTIIDIAGYGRATVLDRGPAVVEVLMGSHEKALEWGVQRKRVRVMN